MYYQIEPALPAPSWETRGYEEEDEPMWDAQCEADRRDEAEFKAEVCKLKHEAMEMIQEMPDDVLEWWESHRAEKSDAATGATWYSKIAGEARRFQFAAATRGHEEPCY